MMMKRNGKWCRKRTMEEEEEGLCCCKEEGDDKEAVKTMEGKQK